MIKFKQNKQWLNFRRRVFILSTIMIPIIIVCFIPITRENSTFYDKMFFSFALTLIVGIYFLALQSLYRIRNIYVNGTVKKAKIKEFTIKSNAYGYKKYATIVIEIKLNNKTSHKKIRCWLKDFSKSESEIKKGEIIEVIVDKKNSNNIVLHKSNLAKTYI